MPLHQCEVDQVCLGCGEGLVAKGQGGTPCRDRIHKSSWSGECRVCTFLGPVYTPSVQTTSVKVV